MTLRLGVLPPGSNFVPRMADDLLAAFRFGLTEARLQADVVVDFAGYNGDIRVLLPRIQHLLLEQRVACVVAPLNLGLVERLAGQFENSGVPLIALNLGEDPSFETARSPCVFVNSFHLWQSAWMGGYLGAQRFGPRASALIGLHEGGYGLSFAFQLGLEAGRGNLVQTAVTHTTSTREDPSPAIADVLSRQPDFIWAGYSGKEAASFLAAYAALSGSHPVPVLGLRPLVDEHVRKAAGASAQGVCYVTAGPPSIDDATTALARAIGHVPPPYAVLAYESAHLLAAAVRAAGAPERGSSALPYALGHAEFQGPRGVVRFDNGTGLDVPFCIRRVAPDGDSIEEFQAPPQLNEQFQLARTRLVKQGWVNPYLCA